MSQDVLSIKPIAPEPSESPESYKPTKLPPISVAEQMLLEQKQRNGANWFLWIAALSLVNSVLTLGQVRFSFAIGSGLTLLIDNIALYLIQDTPDISPIIFQGIAFTLDVAIIGSFAIFALLARRRYVWAFIVGMLFYLVDVAIIFFLELWIGVAFHLFALFGLWGGLQATRTFNQLARENRLATQEASADDPFAVPGSPHGSGLELPATTRPAPTMNTRFWIPAIGVAVGVVVLTALCGQVWGWLQSMGIGL